jgi:hypothetical protein
MKGFAAIACLLALAMLQVSPAIPAGGVVLTVAGVPGNGFTPKKTARLTMAKLRALKQATVTVTIGGVKTVEKGPPVTELLYLADFASLPGCSSDEDNPRYWIQAAGATGGAAVLAGLELDPDGADRLAILSVTENGKPLAAPRLVVRGDRTDARDLTSIDSLTIGRAAPQLLSDNDACDTPNVPPPLTSVPNGGGVIVNGLVPHKTTFTFAQLQAMPQVTQNDTYTSHGAPTTHEEKGPTLYSVLVKADPALATASLADKLRYYVESTSSEDGQPVVVAWAEIDPAMDNDGALLAVEQDGAPALVQDTGPRLTVPGDVSGERYDYGVQVVTLFQAPSPPAAH